MAFQIKLTRGANSIDLTAYPFSVGTSFAPPAVNMSYNISAGTSANVSGGGSLVSMRANNRAFSFSLRVFASTMTEAHNTLRQITSFIQGQSNDTLYLEYRANSSIPIPLWGQFGAPLRYEIVTANVGSPDQNYLVGGGKGFFCNVSLEIKPLTVGQKQKLINASGGVFENTYGSIDGASKSLSIFEATVNKMTNPVFGNSTYDTGWTIGADLTASKNTDARYILPGLTCSMKLSANAGSTVVAYQSINVGNTNKHSFSMYVYKPDLSAVTASDCAIYYNTTLACTYQNLGNGLWCVYSDNVTGINSNMVTGPVVVLGKTIFISGMQIEEKAYHTPLVYGDLLGCAWTGTAHASTSTRTATRLTQSRTDEFINLAQGGVAVVWKPYFANTFGAAMALFGTFKADNSLTGLYAYFDNADDKVKLTDGTNTVATAAQTFSAGDTLYFEFTWGPGGLNISKSGANAATGATYTVPTVTNTAVYDICNRAGIFQAGDILAFDVWDTELTLAQVTAIYTDQSAIVASGKRPSLIPWWWVKDGDGEVDNCDDSTRDNWGVAGGVPGSWDALTDFNIVMGDQLKDIGALYLSNFATNTFISPANFYLDASGTAEANSSGGAVETTSLADGATVVYAAPIVSAKILSELDGREYYGICRVLDAANTTRSIRAVYNTDTNGFDSPYKSITTSSSIYTTQISPPNICPRVKKFINLGNLSIGAPRIGVQIRRDTGGAANILFDFAWVLFRPLIKITGNTLADSNIVLSGSEAADYASGVLQMNGINTTGDIIQLLPQKYNDLMVVMGSETKAHVIATSAIFTITVTPRYTLA